MRVRARVRARVRCAKRETTDCDALMTYCQVIPSGQDARENRLLLGGYVLTLGSATIVARRGRIYLRTHAVFSPDLFAVECTNLNTSACMCVSVRRWADEWDGRALTELFFKRNFSNS